MDHWERPTLLNPPAFRREALGVQHLVMERAYRPLPWTWRGLCRNRLGTNRRRHVWMVRVALDVAADSRWSKSLSDYIETALMLAYNDREVG